MKNWIMFTLNVISALILGLFGLLLLYIIANLQHHRSLGDIIMTLILLSVPLGFINASYKLITWSYEFYVKR